MNQERQQRIRRILRTFAVVMLFLLIFAPFALGFTTLWTLTHTPCGPDTPPSAAGISDYEAVSFYSPALDSDVRGYFVLGSKGVTVIVPPVMGSGRGSWLKEQVLLHEAGYSLFNYESRNCLGQANSLGYIEAIEVGDALDYLLSRPDVDPDQIAIFGFSAGGATATMAAARYPQLQAVIAMGGYHDFAETVDDVAETSYYRPIYYAGAALAYRLATGVDLSANNPMAVIDQIAPRPILLIYGTGEPALPGARLQLERAGENASLMVIEGATHGTYWQYDPEQFESGLIDFLESAFPEAA